MITRYVADFLGFADKVKSNDNPHAEYSENEIYQHITNCQIFFSYNSDETKLIRRRKAFTTSMTFLYELTRAGHIRDATLWGKMKGIFWRSKLNPMEQLGLEIAHQVLEKEPDHGRAAAILLLIGLDSAYHGVVAVGSLPL